jgi:hypothetical protein
MFKSSKFPKVVVLLSALSLLVVGPAAQARMDSVTGSRTSVGAATTSNRTLVGRIVAAEEGCHAKWSGCEDRCMSARRGGGNDATQTKCFQKCQAQLDACH